MNIDNQFLKRTLQNAGKILTASFGKTAVVSGKANRDILTDADLASDTYITQELLKKYPEIPVLSEETVRTSQVEHASRRFVLDPLDGTINFSRGIPEFGISLAYQENKRTVYGLVYLPIKNDFFEGYNGKGSTFAGKTLHVSDVQSLSKSVIAVDTARSAAVVPSYINNLHKKIRAFRSYGCAIEVLGYIAKGNVDAYLYDTPKLWDIAAMECIIKEAGGLVLNHRGNEWHEEEPLLICTPNIRNELIACIENS